MKKNYSKPEIMFESFTMSTNIAAGCQDKVETQSVGVCGIDFDGDMIFTAGVTLCKEVVEDGTGGFCYHNPSDTTAMFGS